MIFYHKVLLSPNPKKRQLLFGAMKLAKIYDAMHGMVMSETPNPACEDYCQLLRRLYSGAVPLAAALIIDYQKTLFQNEELPKRFHRTFGAGENWETDVYKRQHMYFEAVLISFSLQLHPLPILHINQNPKVYHLYPLK